jgi:hypothetical protein
MAGVVMPQDKHFKKILTDKFEDVAVLLFLPLFFVYTGLRTQVGLLNDWNMVLICLGIILTAVVGKFGASTLAARFYGQNWKDSLSLGVLMNTRGLMELVVLNIAYDLGIFPPKIFTMMVIMALSTTFMTGPGLQMLQRIFKTKEKEKVPMEIRDNHVLLSFAASEIGECLLQLSYWLLKHNDNEVDFTALHIKPNDQYHTHGNDIKESQVFKGIQKLGNELGITVNTRFKVTEEIKREIVSIVNKGDFNLLVLAGSRPLYGNNPVSKTVRYALEHCDCRVAVYTNEIVNKIINIITIYYNDSDKFLLEYADNIALNVEAIHTVLKFNNDRNNKEYNYMQYTYSEKMKMKRLYDMPDLQFFDLIVISTQYWDVIDKENSNLKFSKKLLIMKDFLA